MPLWSVSSHILRNSLQKMFSLTVLWPQTVVLGEIQISLIKTALSGIQRVQRGNIYIIKAPSHLFCSLVMGYLGGGGNEAVS